MNTAVTSAHILRHTTSFLHDVISQRDFRRRFVSTLHRAISDQTTTIVNHLKLAGNTLEAAISFSSNIAARSTSLSLTEKLLLRLPESTLSSFLLSLVLTLRNRHTDAAISLLRIFHSDPSLARSEIAPVLYDCLFSLHLVPIFQRFNEQRKQILSSKSLSKMSEDEASKLRNLEREYEKVVDENCKVIAVYFKAVLENEHEDTPPLLIVGEGDGTKNGEEEIEETLTPVFKTGRYNPICTERGTCVDFMSSGSSSNSLNSPFCPRRVSPRIIKPQQSFENLITPMHLNSADEPQFPDN